MKHLTEFIYAYPKGKGHSSLPADYTPTETFQTSDFEFSNRMPEVSQLQGFDGKMWQVTSVAAYAPKSADSARTQRFHVAVCEVLGEPFEPIAQLGEFNILYISALRTGDILANEDGSPCAVWVNDAASVPKVGGIPYEDQPVIVDEVQWFEPLHPNSLHIYPRVAVCWCLDASPVLAG